MLKLLITIRHIVNVKGTNRSAINFTFQWLYSLPRNGPLTHWGLVAPYGDIGLGQLWLRQWFVAWRHQAINWTNVDLSSVRRRDIHLTAVSQRIPQPSICNMSLKITYLNFLSNQIGQWATLHFYTILKFCGCTMKFVDIFSLWASSCEAHTNHPICWTRWGLKRDRNRNIRVRDTNRCSHAHSVPKDHIKKLLNTIPIKKMMKGCKRIHTK